ncbi:MAG: translocation/assembly module TamB [Flavobacteriaceae bacterium]
MKKEKKVQKKTKYRWLRRLARVFLVLLIFFILLILFIRSPWGQGIIVDKVTSYISDKTNTKVAIEKLFITFSGNVSLDGLFLEDKKGDTLVYSKSLEVDVPLWSIIRGKGISIDQVDWTGLRANIIRRDSIQGFNYQFLIDAFAAQDTTTTKNTRETSQTELEVGEVNFNDFDLVFKDDVTGMDSRLKLGKLKLEVEEMDLEKFRFHVSDLIIENTDIQYTQNKPFPESEDAEDSPAPYFIVDRLQLKNVTANYKALPEGINGRAKIGNFILDLPKADLAQQTIDINQITLQESDVFLEITSAEKDTETSENSADTNQFKWPEWIVTVNDLVLENNNLRYSVNGEQPQKGTFNPNAITVENFFFIAEDLYLKEKALGIQLNDFRFEEASGLHLKDFVFDGELTEKKLDISQLSFHLNENILKGNINLQYASVNQLINNPDASRITTTLDRIELSVDELYRFQPDLKNNKYIKALSRKKITGDLKANGTLAAIELPNLNLNWGAKTSIYARGTLLKPMNADSLGLDFPVFNLKTVREDALAFVDEDSIGVRVPEKISLKSNFKGTLNDIQADAVLQTSNGQIEIAGNFRNKEIITYDAEVEVKKLQLGKILKNEQYGELNLTLKSSGEGTNMNNLDAVLETTISSFQLNDYAIEDLSLSGEMENGEGTFTSEYRDDNLDLKLFSIVELDSVSPRFVVRLDLKGADFQALGLTEKNIRGAFVLKADFKGNTETFRFTAEVEDGIAVYDNQSYLLGNLNVDGFVTPDTTSFDITNKMVDVRLRSNAGPVEFSDAIQRHFDRYLSDDFQVAEIENDTVINPVNLEIDAKISQAPIIRDVFLTRLQEMDTIDIQLDFRESKRELTANILIPHINYNGNEVDSLALGLQSDAENFALNLNFRNIIAGPLDIKRTSLEGKIENKKFLLDFNSYFEDEKIAHFNSEITRRNDTIRLHIDPAELIINKKEWNIPEGNEILYTENWLAFTDFNIQRNGQKFTLSSSRPEIEKEHIAVTFENFRLSDFLDYLNPEETLAKGSLNGNLIMEDPFGSLGLIADLEINEFNVMDVALGTLTLEAQEQTAGVYDFNLALKGGDVDLDLTGDYEADETAAKLNLDLALNEVKISAIEGFSGGEVTDAEGSFSGSIKVSGTTADPQYKGNITFDNARFKIAKLNAGFRLANESIRIDNEGLFLDSFQIEDENGNNFVVDGSILTESYTNPEFDLQFEANNFRLLNSTRDDNELFYGTAVVDIDATLTGNLNLPKLDAKLNVGKQTNVTYIMAESELAIEEREGVVIFVNREDPDNILTRTQEESYAVSGFDVNAMISINQDAIFNVIIDEQTGDNFQIGGEGDLNFNINPNGRTTLSGRYTLNQGHFEINLYDLVKRRFEIAKGSTVTWAGDPVDAILDIRAIYRVEASASSLMAPASGSFDAGMNNRFRQQLPFLVYLNIDGELMQPVLTFDLDMPEDQQGAIGGQVYGRVQQLNQQEEELNKQVFSLLVLNRFFPESGSDGSQGGAMSLARNNINQALSERMNKFSDQLLGSTGVELDFGLDSFTDYGEEGSQERTQLDITARKRLFDDRVIVSVGSEVDIEGSSQNSDERSPVIGNVSVEYLLTENGRFRLKGFRRNQFENVIDGQLIVSGIALIFTREFDKFGELFAKAVEEQEESTSGKKDEEEETNEEKNDQDEG